MNGNGGVVIERGVPLANLGAPIKYPFEQMLVGDSFVVDIRKRESVIAAALRRNFRVATRKLDDDRVRIWRVA